MNPANPTDPVERMATLLADNRELTKRVEVLTKQQNSETERAIEAALTSASSPPAETDTQQATAIVSKHIRVIGPAIRTEAAALIASIASALARQRPKAGHGWIPVGERLPEDGVLVMVYTPRDCNGEPRFDYDARGDGEWIDHSNSHEHFLACKSGGDTGPSADAPYTHWMPLPDPPALSASQPTKQEKHDA